ncbi:uncharacterized protein GIQ15_01020 [Arthroderma uncinatum]|uniref:uncharacterized protein n=1 Tax=Arthroderma uncinatum TaxID=74035 RepID=UPI00144A7EFE|nr:uncharacterized protein GIQ15_01020 [Arthroderma uncinatum]KAF3491503.1 hypothetical protein GIQ15_01020 [Arthroderma uncinatum]
MATISAPQTPNLNGGSMIDPTRQGEYPILLGDKLAGRETARDRQFVNVTYNYKSKGGTPQQRTTISSAGTPDRYKLTIQDKAGNAEQTNLTYVYDGGVDPESTASKSENSNLVLIYDPKRKAFILEPVSTRLNFNLKSAPGKTDRQVAEQYSQLNTSFSKDDQSTGDSAGRQADNESEDEDLGPADADNPFDYRHFLPKKKAVENKQRATGYGSSPGTPDPHQVVSKPVAPRSVPAPAAKPKPKPKPKAAPKSKAQPNPLRPPKQRQPKAASSGNATAKEPEPVASAAISLPPKPEPVETIIESVETPDLVGVYSASDDEHKSRLAASPGSNIIVDGDLIIDMGSPPPQRPTFNETGYRSDDEDEIDDNRPSFLIGRRLVDDDDEENDEDEIMEDVPSNNLDGDEEPADFEDDLVAEMEAALEESAREEEARLAMEQQQQRYNNHVPSDDESEVSEEE